MGTYEYENKFDLEYYFLHCNNLENFVSYYTQLKEIYALKPFTVLEVGIGNGLVYSMLNRIGIITQSVDINGSLYPDWTGDIRNLFMFGDNRFDVVCAFEVLEHIPFSDFEHALEELKRVCKRHVLISVPIAKKGIEFYLKVPKFKPFYLYIDNPIRFKQKEVKDNTSAHYWEVNKKGYSKLKLINIISKHFKILKCYRPTLNKYHLFFVLEKKDMM